MSDKPKPGTGIDDRQSDVVDRIEALDHVLSDLDAYLTASHNTLPSIGRITDESGRRAFGFLYTYLDDAHRLGRLAVADVRQLASMAISGNAQANAGTVQPAPRAEKPRSRDSSRATDAKSSRR